MDSFISLACLLYSISFTLCLAVVGSVAALGLGALIFYWPPFEIVVVLVFLARLGFLFKGSESLTGKFLFSLGMLAKDIILFPFTVMAFTLIKCFIEIKSWPFLIRDIFWPWIVRVYQRIMLDGYLTNHQDLQAQCEDCIIRLQMLSQESAQQKAFLLAEILENVKRDRPASPEKASNHLLKQLLQKNYPISYQGEICHLSFIKVAAMRRANADNFSVVKNYKPWLGFFGKSQTTTAKQLANFQLTSLG